MTEERSTETALARYSLILSALREATPRLKRQLRQSIAAKVQPFPDGPRRVSERSLYTQKEGRAVAGRSYTGKEASTPSSLAPGAPPPRAPFP